MFLLEYHDSVMILVLYLIFKYLALKQKANSIHVVWLFLSGTTGMKCKEVLPKINPKLLTHAVGFVLLSAPLGG